MLFPQLRELLLAAGQFLCVLGVCLLRSTGTGLQLGGGVGVAVVEFLNTVQHVLAFESAEYAAPQFSAVIHPNVLPFGHNQVPITRFVSEQTHFLCSV